MVSEFSLRRRGVARGDYRNRERFPNDFIFQLTAEEKAEVVANCDHQARPSAMREIDVWAKKTFS